MAICTLLADYINRVPEPLLELVDCSVDPPVAITPSELLRIFMTAEPEGAQRPKRSHMAITTEQLENWFTYHAPDGEEDLVAYEAIRNAGFLLAQTIVTHTPPSADQTAAVRKVREATMTANAARACKGL
jgi:hypothetical protein